MKKILDRPWFFLIEFTCITLALILWSNNPSLSWQPLIIAIAPLLLRSVTGRTPFTRTPFDIPMAIFVITAAIGVWAAYQPDVAWTKFWLIISSVLFYYLLTRQKINNLWVAAGSLCLLAFVIGIYFLMSTDWDLQAQKFHLLGKIGMAWMQINPFIGLKSIHPNDIAGITDLSLPFSIALMVECWRRKMPVASILFGLITSLILATNLFSASRGSWIAILITCSLWILWVFAGWLTRHFKLQHRTLFAISLGLIACLMVGSLWFSLNNRMNQIAVGDEGVPVLDQRFHLFWSTIELIKDVPFTGGGLDNFPGLYSSYVLINPNYTLGYSHNIFLDATLQQGILGGLMLIWIYLGSILWLVLRRVQETQSLLRIAILSSLLIIIFHSLVDVILYRSIFTSLLFFVPGMAVGLAISSKREELLVSLTRSKVRHLAITTIIALVILIIGLVILHRQLQSAWYTNLGAVEMARIELADFPTGKWEEDQDIDSLSQAKSLYNKALIYDPENPRTHYRLGMIALKNRDYSTAVDHMEIAHHGDPYHRGMLKALGYSYLWNGQIEGAYLLLSMLPEIEYEVSNYVFWWIEENRFDLVNNAELYLQLSKSGVYFK